MSAADICFHFSLAETSDRLKKKTELYLVAGGQTVGACQRACRHGRRDGSLSHMTRRGAVGCRLEGSDTMGGDKPWA